jgi:hypothetical protein
VITVYMGLWEQGPDDPELAQAVQQGCDFLSRFARVFPIGAPQAWLCQGQIHAMAGYRVRARRAWRRALAAAERLAMPYEQGLAHAALGRHLPVGDPEGQAHRARAGEIFASLGATHPILDFRF